MTRPLRLPVALALLALAIAPRAQAQSDRPPRVPILSMQIMRPFVVQVEAVEVSPRIPDCTTHRVWSGRLAPTDPTGRRVSGRLKYFDLYEGAGCAKMINGQRAGMCTGSNEAQYDAVADVSAIDVPVDAKGPALGRLAAGASDGWTLYAAQRLGHGDEPPAKRATRVRLSMRVAMRASSLRTNNSCLAVDQGKAMNELLAGQWFPLPPFLLPTETEPSRGLAHNFDGGNMIRAWAWWRSDLQAPPDADLLTPLGASKAPR